MTEGTDTQYDSARTLTRAGIGFVALLICFVAYIIARQIEKTGEANTESWAALTGIIGWATGQLSAVFNARFGTSQQSRTKDETIAVLSKTASAATDNAQTNQVAALAAAAVPVQPVRTDNLNVDATGASITIDKGKPT